MLNPLHICLSRHHLQNVMQTYDRIESWCFLKIKYYGWRVVLYAGPITFG